MIERSSAAENTGERLAAGWFEAFVLKENDHLTHYPRATGLAEKHPDLYRRIYQENVIQDGPAVPIGIVYIDVDRANTRNFLEQEQQSGAGAGKALTPAIRRLFQEFDAGLGALAQYIQRHPHSALAQVRYFVGRTRLATPSEGREKRSREEGVMPTRMGKMGFEVYAFEGDAADHTSSHSHDLHWHSLTSVGMTPQQANKIVAKRDERLVVMPREVLLALHGKDEVVD